MTLHDAAILRWGQWWRRNTRTGYAFAEGSHLFGAPPERHWVRESQRSRLWGLADTGADRALPRSGCRPGSCCCCCCTRCRCCACMCAESGPPRWRALQAIFTTLGYFPEAAGHLRYWRNRLMERRQALIEYK